MVYLGSFLERAFFHVGMRQFVTFNWKFGRKKIKGIQILCEKMDA